MIIYFFAMIFSKNLNIKNHMLDHINPPTIDAPDKIIDDDKISSSDEINGSGANNSSTMIDIRKDAITPE
jgi:hypothetical protein